MIEYECKKCGHVEEQRAECSAVEHVCPKANQYDKDVYGGLVPLTPKVRCTA